ncbi:MAG: 6-bladed beta-propeller [Acidobacteriota bacterium]|nr:6-bladed beta-propeller [Acidobacteriota bacterium]
MALLFCVFLAGGWTLDTENLSGFFGHMTGLALTPDSNLVVLDYSQTRVYLLDKNGKETGWFGRQGSGPGEMTQPEALHVTPDGPYILVADAGSKLVHVYGADGRFVRDLRADHNLVMAGKFLADNRVAVLQTHDPLVKAKQGARLVLSAWDGSSPRTLLQFSAEQHIDTHIGHHNGSYAYMDFPWDPKVRFTTSPDGRFIFASPNSRLTVRVIDAAAGKEVGRIEDKLRRLPLTREHIEANRQRLSAGGKLITAKSYRHGDARPAFQKLLADHAGRLWVSETPVRDAAVLTYRLYKRDGARLGKVFLPKDLVIWAADAEYLYATRTTDETTHIIKQKLEPAPF